MKKILSFIIVLIVITAIPFSVSANRYLMDYGTSGDFKYISKNDGTADIYEYTGSADTLVIPSDLNGYPVTGIRDHAFVYHPAKSITIPNTVTSIGWNAFNYYLERIVVESGNPKYDSRDNCNAIIDSETDTIIYGFKNTVIPETVKSIGNEAFFMTDITDLTIPTSVQSIGEKAFLYCDELKSVTIPDTVTSFGKYAIGYLFPANQAVDGVDHKVEGFTIYGYSGSAADDYARENGFNFVSLGTARILAPDSNQFIIWIIIAVAALIVIAGAVAIIVIMKKKTKRA